MVCRDASSDLLNQRRISAFKSGNKLQLSVDYLSAYPLLPLHYLCSLLFYYKGICTQCVEVCDTYLIVLPINCSVVKLSGYCHPYGVKGIASTNENKKFHYCAISQNLLFAISICFSSSR